MLPEDPAIATRTDDMAPIVPAFCRPEAASIDVMGRVG
jgi:hypothetical protein